MAYPPVSSALPAKLSFAKIAAMPAPNVAPALPNVIKESKPRSSSNAIQHNRTNSSSMPPSNHQALPKAESESQVEDVSVGIDGLSLIKTERNISDVPPSGASAESVADDQSQLSTSSLKQQSFDTKSMASVTTFAMDEKESIRPDDSASVRAVEEDDIHPGLSRNSSFQHDIEQHPSLSKSNVRMLSPNVTITARRYPYTTLTNPPRFGDLPPVHAPEPAVPQSLIRDEPSSSLTEDVRARPVLAPNTPDEKLIEALSSLKDRLPLLQLEEKLIAFINNSRDTILELPPQNSFTRLLTHKIADYYNLAHHINDENNSVRIFRTEYCAVPVSLAEIAKSVPIGPQHISHATQVKIMRRVQLGPRQFSAGNSTAASSSVASKATSENGFEPTSEEGVQSPLENTPNKDRSKLTREEREAQYKAARERIFGDFQESVTSESGSTGEASASMSRSSSSSGKKKPRKSKTPKDDTFEARSSFVPSYAPIHMQPAYQQGYGDSQYGTGYSTTSYSPQGFNVAQSQNYTSYDPGLAYNNQIGYTPAGTSMYCPVEGWQNQQQTPSGNLYGFQPHQQFPQQTMHHQVNNQYQQTSSPALQNSQNWTPNQYQAMYMSGPNSANMSSWQGFGPANTQSTLSYQYGQLPAQNSATNVPFSSQHPVPGSYTGNKSLFNPQTRSFVPNNASVRGGARGGRKKGQGAGSGRTSGASSPAVSSLSDGNNTKPKEDSLQQKYGTPANLPKKPPPSQVSPLFGTDHSTNGGIANGGPVVVSNTSKSPAS